MFASGAHTRTQLCDDDIHPLSDSKYPYTETTFSTQAVGSQLVGTFFYFFRLLVRVHDNGLR